MLIQDNLVLTRVEPTGQGGTQFLYRVHDYGIAAVSSPNEDVTLIHWKVDVIKYRDSETLQYDAYHDTDLGEGPLKFKNDKSANEFLKKAFAYFEELNTLDGMMNK